MVRNIPHINAKVNLINIKKDYSKEQHRKKNAEKRIKNHKFSFTDKVSMEIVPEKQKNNFLNDYLNNYL